MQGEGKIDKNKSFHYKKLSEKKCEECGPCMMRCPPENISNSNKKSFRNEETFIDIGIFKRFSINCLNCTLSKIIYILENSYYRVLIPFVTIKKMKVTIYDPFLSKNEKYFNKKMFFEPEKIFYELRLR